MWELVYKKAFPTFATMCSVPADGWAQRGGIDRVITLSSGKTLLVDEKLREKDWPDILLEYYSDRDRKIPGWIWKDLACDYIAYAFLPSRRCYLLPFHLLRSCWLQNGREWARRFTPPVEALNFGYVTESVAVPIDVLLTTMKESLMVSW